MPPAAEDVEPVTVYDAAEPLGCAPQTIHVWAIRYGARKLGKLDGRTIYDFRDLVVIEREIRHGHPVPATWQDRAVIRRRCPLSAAAPAA